MKTMLCNPTGPRFLSLWISLMLCACQAMAQSGCTDEQASNFNPIAVVNDGSCIYATTISQPNVSMPLNAVVSETSGLLYWQNQLWTHNDDTDGQFYAIDTLTGEISDTINWSALTNVDWEEVQCNENFVVIGDIGNNMGNRTDLKFFVIPYNDFASGDLSVVDTIAFSYADQTNWTPSLNNNDFDAEAFLLTQDSIFIFSKCWSSLHTKRYALPFQNGSHVAQKREEWDVQGLITGAAWDDGMQRVLLCGYNNVLMPFAFLLFDYSNGEFFNGNKRKIILGLGLHQVEAVASRGNGEFVFTNEMYNGPVVISAAIHSGWSIQSWITDVEKIKQPMEGFALYPNPASDYLTIALPPSVQSLWKYEIWNSQGKRMDKGRFLGVRHQLDVASLTPGVYTILLLKGQQYYPYRFIKE
ncbi:MAG: hypothetical protein RLY35_1711 [Bacteroidota bacterium]